MGNCELCGLKPARYNAEIEGTTMNVCEDCGKFGKVKKNTVITYVERKKFEAKEPTYIFIQGYGSIVKNAREKLGLKQEEMAKKLNERESILHNIESEHFKPSVETAMKLEHALKIKIIEEIKDDDNASGASNKGISNKSGNMKAGPVTLGDMMNVKKRK